MNETGDNTTQRQRLMAAARQLARRPAGASSERWLLLGGGVVLPFGLVCILLGYWGAAHTSRVIQQIPYEISGGIFGLALVFTGGFAYFAWWITGLVREQRRLAEHVDRQTDALAAAMSRIENLLDTSAAASVATTVAAARSRTKVTTSRVSRAAAASLVATPTGSLVHRPDCPVVANRKDTRRVKPEDGEMKPCRICAPDLAAVPAAT